MAGHKVIEFFLKMKRQGNYRVSKATWFLDYQVLSDTQNQTIKQSAVFKFASYTSAYHSELNISIAEQDGIIDHFDSLLNEDNLNLQFINT